jgi:hypothetical protein
MDARLMKRFALVLILSATACSKKDSSPVDAQEKNALLSAVTVLQKKGYCLPNPILDEEDIVPLVNGGYKLSPEDQYCVPESDGTFVAGDYNCVPKIFVDSFDATYLLNNSYHDDGAEYCNNVVVTDPGTTSGSTSGSTTGSTDGGSVSGGSTTAGSTDGGSVTGGGTDGGSVTGGSVSGGSTIAGTTDGGSVTGGSTDGGSITGGSVSGGSTTAGTTDGGSVTGGSTDGGSVTGGSVSGGSTTAGTTDGGSVTGGSTDGGSVTGGSVSGGSTDGGSVTGGSVTGGSTDGGSVSGGSTSGGSTTGGSTTGGSTTAGCNNGDNSGDGDVIWSQPIDRMCSKLRTGNDRYSLLDREALFVQVLKRVQDKHTKKYSNTIICETSDTARIKKDLVENRKVRIPNCDLSHHKKSDLVLTIFSPVVAKDLPISMTDFSNVRFFKKDSDVTGRDELSFVLYGSRANRYVPLNEKFIVIVDNNPDGTAHDPLWCDAKASPLIVHVNPDQDVAEYVQLSSQANGVKFDILGLNSEPAAHMVKKISWTSSKQYMFLVKPNAHGKVNGVDEMFGDNTYGPDKDFSPNGFLALAKYDDNKDGVIDADDAIFFKLRLWIDKNRDGIGSASEMITLSKAKVKLIDLHYDASFRETDKYGNETVYKSVIKYNNGSLDLIFDLWFNYKN